MSRDLVKRIDLLLTESLATTLAKTAAIVAAPSVLKFVVDLITKLTKRLVGKLSNSEDSKEYYRELRDKIDSALISKGFKYDQVIKSDPGNPGVGDTIVFISTKSPMEIKVHLDNNYNPVRITTVIGTERHSVDLPSYKNRNKPAFYAGVKFR